MTEARIGAVTFDLWDTVFVDDSDEPKRAAEGLAPKCVERRNLVERFLAKNGAVRREQVDRAYDVADAAFRRAWYEQNITWTVRQRLSAVLKQLNRRLPEDELAELVRLHEEMELGPSPDLAEGIAEALAKLQGRYRLGVISDAIFSPGRVLRQLLEYHGIKHFFESFIFSDEIGCAKPSPAMFEAAARELSVATNEIVHVGDREPKDVEGAHAVGARAILCTVVRDRCGRATKADAVCRDFSELPGLLEELEGR